MLVTATSPPDRQTEFWWEIATRYFEAMKGWGCADPITVEFGTETLGVPGF
jgi:hypothetical protein